MWMESLLFTGRNFKHASISKSEDASAGKQKVELLLFIVPIIQLHIFTYLAKQKDNVRVLNNL